MDIARTVNEVRALVAAKRAAGQVVGLVPTMGNLHAGHLDLIDKALSRCDFVICSIFVNPTQFGANEDFGSYPRTFDLDSEALEQRGCHCVFNPSVDEIYPGGAQADTQVSVPQISRDYCGAARPGHFDGVATVVTKLFTICQPDQAFFGLKDYQQLLVIKQLVRDLLLPIEIVPVEIKREPDGLAMSSRNAYLSAEERQKAPTLNQQLNIAAQQISEGNRDYRQLERDALSALTAASLLPDYFAICDATSLSPATPSDGELVILAAVKLGRSRLIDNVRLHVDNP